jgi:hypothetical protein
MKSEERSLERFLSFTPLVGNSLGGENFLHCLLYDGLHAFNFLYHAFTHLLYSFLHARLLSVITKHKS